MPLRACVLRLRCQTRFPLFVMHQPKREQLRLNYIGLQRYCAHVDPGCRGSVLDGSRGDAEGKNIRKKGNTLARAGRRWSTGRHCRALEREPMQPSRSQRLPTHWNIAACDRARFNKHLCKIMPLLCLRLFGRCALRPGPLLPVLCPPLAVPVLGPSFTVLVGCLRLPGCRSGAVMDASALGGLSFPSSRPRRVLLQSELGSTSESA